MGPKAWYCPSSCATRNWEEAHPFLTQVDPTFEFVWVCCMKRPGAGAWLERASLPENSKGRCTVSELGSERGRSPALVPAGVHVPRLWTGRRTWCLPALLFQEKSSNDPCPSSTLSEVSKQPLSCIPQALFKLFLRGCLLCYLFKGRDSVSSHPPGYLSVN